MSPNGRIIASLTLDNVARKWDGTPSSAELRARREALGEVRVQLKMAASERDYFDRIRRDPTISDEVRRQALKLADGLWKDEAVSRSSELNRESWDVVKVPLREEASYRDALRKAEQACRLQPNDPNALNTLGVARYRAGLYREALTTLTRSNDLNRGEQPGDLAFLAMSQQRVGQTDVASATLERLRKIMKAGNQQADQENQSFLREAEMLILDALFPSDPFAP